ncbi:hypothetical protein E2C01_052928 [Portunus trituberculatus]|uniref:Uncharacterized protein n=1 Tax=Portunus trituberculatus TaxID=210409 RepID=A0A5B7GNR4_PORTR|nr:hypothetical protein [Portunus trituberculatus]
MDDEEVHTGMVVKEEVVSSSPVCGEYKPGSLCVERYDAESSLPTPFQHQIGHVPCRERSYYLSY